MGLIAIEGTENGVHWTADGRSSHTATSVEAVMDGLDGAHVVICEPSFYDGLRDVRRILGEILASRGHRLVPVGCGAKAALAVAAGDGDFGSGVCRLFSIVKAGSGRLDRLRANAENPRDVRDAINIVHAMDSLEPLALDLIMATEAVGPYATLSGPMKVALGDGLAYRGDVLLAAYRAATVATNRKEFEQFLGLTARGHGAMTQTLRAWYAERNTTDHFERESVLQWSDYRQALRWVYHRIKEGRQGMSWAA